MDSMTYHDVAIFDHVIPKKRHQTAVFLRNDVHDVGMQEKSRAVQ